MLKELAKPGMKEAVAAVELSRILRKDRIDSVCRRTAADERANRFRHAVPTERTVQKYLMLNVNARKWGLVATLTRSVHFDKADPKLTAQYRPTTFVERGMTTLTRPGTLLADIFAKTCDLYERFDYRGQWKNHHQGGAQGYRNRDYLMTSENREKVVEDQCFCWNPSIGGTKTEDAIIAQSGGPLFITKPMVLPTLTLDYEG